MSFDIKINVKADSTKATEELNKLSAQLTKLYGTPAEMLGMIAGSQTDRHNANTNSNLTLGLGSLSSGYNKELTVALATALGLVFVPGAPIVGVLGRSVASAVIGHFAKKGLEHFSQLGTTAPGQIDVSSLNPLQIQNTYDAVIDAIGKVGQALQQAQDRLHTEAIDNAIIVETTNEGIECSAAIGFGKTAKGFVK